MAWTWPATILSKGVDTQRAADRLPPRRRRRRWGLRGSVDQLETASSTGRSGRSRPRARPRHASHSTAVLHRTRLRGSPAKRGRGQGRLGGGGDGENRRLGLFDSSPPKVAGRPGPSGSRRCTDYLKDRADGFLCGRWSSGCRERGVPGERSGPRRRALRGAALHPRQAAQRQRQLHRGPARHRVRREVAAHTPRSPVA